MKNIIPYKNSELQKEVLKMSIERVSSDETIALSQIKKWAFLLIDNYNKFKLTDKKKLKKAIEDIGFYTTKDETPYWIEEVIKKQPMFAQLCFLHLINSNKLKEEVGENLHYKFCYREPLSSLFSISSMIGSFDYLFGFQENGFYLGNFSKWDKKPIFIKWHHLADIKNNYEATLLNTKKNPIIIHIENNYEVSYRLFTAHKQFKKVTAFYYWEFRKLIEFKNIMCGNTGKEIKFIFNKNEILEKYLSNIL